MASIRRRRPSASEGGEKAVLEWLVERRVLEGAVYDDAAIFQRAHWLRWNWNAPIRVHTLEYQFSDEEFATIRAQLLHWHEQEQNFLYVWPQRGLTPMPPDRDNCATFPRKLGIAIPEPSGHLALYITSMIDEHGAVEWNPET